MFQQVRDKLRSPATIYAKNHLAMLIGLARRDWLIRRYFATHPNERYLRIGAGAHADRDWLSCDLVPLHRGIVYIDNTKPFPLPNRSFDAIVCEHMIEHVSYDSGMNVLRECHRVLKAGGVLRIVTPDLAFFCHLIDRIPSGNDIAYIEWSNATFDSQIEGRSVTNPAFVVNRAMRAWGHTFLYDQVTLTDALACVGFRNIVRVAAGRSKHSALASADRHGDEVGELFNEIESLVLEATAES